MKRSVNTKNFHPGIMRCKPTVVVLCGRKGSGKTTMCISLLTNEWLGVYDKIVIISPTIANQESWEDIDMSDIDVYDSVDDRLLNALLAERSSNYAAQTCLVVFDDLGEDLRRCCNLKILNKLVSNSRHLKLSMCFLHQKVTQAHPIIRTNADTFIMFSSSSYSERECLWREVSVVDKRHFGVILNKASDERFGCLVCSTGCDGKMYLYNKDGDVLQ